MPGAFAPRFAVEAGFLILVGVGAGYADLRPAVIVGLVAASWVLVALIEFAIWRSQSRAGSGSTAVAAGPAEDEPEPEPEQEPEPGLPPAASEDEYPLRPGAADARSEEVEEYTRILSGSPAEERSPAQLED
jgi:hypothetical protein